MPLSNRCSLVAPSDIFKLERRRHRASGNAQQTTLRPWRATHMPESEALALTAVANVYIAAVGLLQKLWRTVAV